MRQLSPAGQQIIQDLAQRHGCSTDGVHSMLQSVINGNGTMAQFSHPDFGGSGQWMQGGMTMVSDLFNNYLKNQVNNLCQDLANLLANEPHLLQSGSFQSQSQGGGQQQQGGGQQQFSGGNQQQQGSGGPMGNVSLFVPATRENTGQWWPADLGQPSSTGSQNEMRYAYFPQARRLAVNVNGKISVYDTMDHQIGGFSQQQSGGSSVTFTSQYGLVSLLSLPIISGESLLQQPAAEQQKTTPIQPPETAPQEYFDNATPIPQPQPTSSNTDTPGNSDAIFATLEKLARLLEQGILTQEEFAEKKRELLSRL